MCIRDSPTIEHIVTTGKPVIQVLVLTPTRELAMQVSEAMSTYGKSAGVKVTSVYGGQPIGRQLDALRRGVHVVVATPGRAIDHLKRGSLDLDQVRTVVLDEADEMLDMGFTRRHRAHPRQHAKRPSNRSVFGHDATSNPCDREAASTGPGHGQDWQS